MRKTMCWLFLFVVIVICSVCGALADEATAFPKEYVISEADENRYREVWESATENAPFWIISRHPSVEEKHELWLDFSKIVSDTYSGRVDGLPTASDISEECALFLGYAAMEDKYGYDGSVLCLFYPDLSFDVSHENRKKWVVALIPFDESVYSAYGQFYIDIDAQTGEVLSCVGPDDAVG